MYLTFAVSRPVARFFLRGDAIQQVDGPNEAEGASLFVGGRGGGFDCPRLHFVRFEGGMIKKHVAKSETWIFREMFELEN